MAAAHLGAIGNRSFVVGSIDRVYTGKIRIKTRPRLSFRWEVVTSPDVVVSCGEVQPPWVEIRL
jgi:hypothetical protein